MRFQEPFISEIALNTYAINEFGMATAFVVAGKEKALLIDTGVGLCDLPTLVRRCTDLPYDVVLTHGHIDHAGGVGHFTDIWLHPADFPMVESLDPEGVRGYNRMMAQRGSLEAYDFDPEAVKPIEKLPEFHALKEGDVLDLGGRSLTVIETPGHTPGSICLLDESVRILFSGDACNVNLGLFGATVSEALAGLEKLEALRDRFDRNYNGHVGYLSTPNCLSMPDHVLDDCIDICRSVLDGAAQPETAEWFGGKMANAVVKNGTRVSYPSEAAK